MEPGNAAEWATAVAALGAALVALRALYMWPIQMRATTRHEAAAEIAEAAELLWYHFYDARNPFYASGEFPAEYLVIENPTDRQNADAWAHVFQTRWDILYPHILKLATLRAKTKTLLSDECAVALDEYARKARELSNFFRERVIQYRNGENIVAQWPDQSWVQRVRKSIQVEGEDHSDPYSLEFEGKYDLLKAKTYPFI
jgi:hypothetical protein